MMAPSQPVPTCLEVPLLQISGVNVSSNDVRSRIGHSVLRTLVKYILVILGSLSDWAGFGGPVYRPARHVCLRGSTTSPGYAKDNSVSG
jgi:hypothetical protein